MTGPAIDPAVRPAAEAAPAPTPTPVPVPEPVREQSRDQGRFIARAAAVTAALTAAGALAGLVRDQTIAHLFGAGAATDAFLVSWTLPEIAATLLIEDAMALVLIPAFSLALARRTEPAPPGAPDGAPLAAPPAPDPVRALLAATLPRLLLALSLVTGLLVVFAAPLVRLLAPGLADLPRAVECTRLTALTVLAFGVAGYFSAALRAHRRFVTPAAIYLAYNLVIVATVLLLHARWGVRAAAAGVALGGLVMVLVQLPAFLRQLPARGPRRRAVRRAVRRRGAVAAVPRAALVTGAAVLVPVALFTLGRQSQVLVERFLASSLSAGAISHLNYAQKVAQIPMVLSLMICTVTFPLVARAMAEGERGAARRRVERDLALAALVVLTGAAYVIGYAPQLIELLFQRGAFDHADTAATASVMRVYALGLLGHSMVGALVRPYFSAGRPTWYPAAAMAAGLLVTVVAGAAAAPAWGVHGIAGANAAGISLTALLLLYGLGDRRGRGSGQGQLVGIELRRVRRSVGRLLPAAAAAAAAGWATAPLCGSAPAAVALGALLVPAVFAATALAAGSPEVPRLLSTVTRRFRHVP